MARKDENSGFICKNCDKIVSPIKKGSIRNHCPFCLCSLHVDIKIGDRNSDCHGLMKPIGIVHNSQKGWQIQHKCQDCGFLRLNIVSDDDDFELICKISAENSRK
ncbi:MAG: RNHCP domain-containing protein [Defluviitaleaceae bacterium]|nr:RNHCP domain-containing protein [Defluviitaleaceae bacterium]